MYILSGFVYKMIMNWFGYSEEIQIEQDLSVKEYVKEMRGSSEIENKIHAEADTLKKCIMCKYFLSSQKWSHVLEKHLKDKFEISKKLNNTSGDGISKNGHNVEIKISLNEKLNIVQIRPHHTVDYYIIMHYDISKGELGEINWFLISSEDMNVLIFSYGQYAHGTTKKNGSITRNSIRNGIFEYALRPKKDSELLQAMMQFKVDEKAIHYI